MHAKSVGIAILIALCILAWDPRIVEDVLHVPDTVLVDNVPYVPPPAPLKVPDTVFFVGDIMLGRVVETKMESYGTRYPFEGVLEDVFQPDVSIGNFEGVVTETHVHTPPFTFQFSIKPEYLTLLKTIGFDVLSLANNHSLDYGTSSLAYTQTLCTSYGLVCGGSPKNTTQYQTVLHKVGTQTAGIMFLHTLYGQPDTETIISKLAELRKTTDVQIAYVHWGEEYALTHNATQEKLAHMLIDNGVDVVVGHHPHVVQDVELYSGKPIVYSLGNFIFDQYFSDEVQEMIGVHMSILDDSITYTIVPFTSSMNKSQPHHMEEKDATILLGRIFAPIAHHEGVDRALGTITVPR